MRAESLKMNILHQTNFMAVDKTAASKSRTCHSHYRQTVSKPTFLKIVFGEVSVRNLKYGNCGAVYLVLRQTAVTSNSQKMKL